MKIKWFLISMLVVLFSSGCPEVEDEIIEELNYATISGTVTDSDGNPIAELIVRVVPADGSTQAPAGNGSNTDGEGVYNVQSVPPGVQYVLIQTTTCETWASADTTVREGDDIIVNAAGLYRADNRFWDLTFGGTAEGNSSSNRMAQEFIPTVSNLKRIDVHSSDATLVEIRADNAGIPSDTVLASQGLVQKPEITKNGSQVATPGLKAVFTTPLTLTPNEHYWIVMNASYLVFDCGQPDAIPGLKSLGSTDGGIVWSSTGTVNSSTSTVRDTDFITYY